MSKVHEVYKGYEIELIRGRFERRDSMAYGTHTATKHFISSDAAVTPKEAVEQLKAKIDIQSKTE